MKWTNPALYLVGALLTLGPVGLRVLSRPDPPQHSLDEVAVREGHKLFIHEWQPNDPLCPSGDGLGPVYNATSCVACHQQGGVGGSGGIEQNVTTFIVQPQSMKRPLRQGVVHAFATQPDLQETLRHVDPALPPVRRPSLEMIKKLDNQEMPLSFTVHVSQRNTPALFGAKLIDELPDRAIIAAQRSQRLRWGLAESDDVPVGKVLRLAGGRVGKFGWKAQSANLLDFVQAACANELGLGNPGQDQPQPLGQAGYERAGLDLTAEQCNQMTAFIASLKRPVERIPADPNARASAQEGKQLFTKVGCADCHTPNIGSIQGIYSDLLLHRMGEELRGIGSYNDVPQPQSPSEDSPRPDEWRTPPLWGVADSAPYLHDGRAKTLEEAIQLHAGQAKRAALNFSLLSPTQRGQVIDFLKTLRAPQ